MKQLYYNNKIELNSTYKIIGKDFHYIKNVIRLRNDDIINILDKNNNKYQCKITSVNKDDIKFTVLKKLKNNSGEYFTNIHLYFSLIKNKKIELILEKVTELGITTFNPIITDYCSYELKSINKNKIERWKTIIKSAVQQCGRNSLPKLNQIKKLNEISININNLNILLDETSDKTFLNILHKYYSDSISDVNIFVGPEGSFSDSEKDIIIKKYKAKPVSISNNILRSETASISVISIIQNYLDYYIEVNK